MTDGDVAATALDGVFVFTPQRIDDDRGWFVRTLDLAWCEERGLECSFVHQNQSRSRRGVLRGIHVRAGRGETKLVRCARGSVVDHVVDVRPWSPTYGRSERFVLDDEAHRHLYLPPFVAHGFQVVSDWADVCYLHSRVHEPGSELTIRWDDPALALDWPLADPVLVPRDAEAPRLAALDLTALFEQPGDRRSETEG